MRMISDRDDRILGELARAAGNDLDIVREALEAVTRTSKTQDRKVRVEEAVNVIRRLKGERRTVANDER